MESLREMPQLSQTPGLPVPDRAGAGDGKPSGNSQVRLVRWSPGSPDVRRGGASTRGDEAVQSRTARALVVDDEENVSYLASAALRLNGWTVQVSDNGQEALAAANTFRPM
jgi:hypothetical protein